MAFGQRVPDPMLNVTDIRQLGPIDDMMGDRSTPLIPAMPDGLAGLRQEGQNPSSVDQGHRDPLPGLDGSGDSGGLPTDPDTIASAQSDPGPGPVDQAADSSGPSNTRLGAYDGGSNDFSVLGGPQSDPDVRAAIAALYGDDIPLLKDVSNDADWVAWGEHLWESYGPGVQAAIHLVERNRLIRKGMQWISSIGYGPWREPAKPRDAARVVDNMISPALDMRVQLIREQRPGFQCEPSTSDPEQAKTAEAMQLALEYHWKQQRMERIGSEAEYWAGTDAVTFLELYWDPDAGPWQDLQKFNDPETKAMLPYQQGMKLGDVATRVRRIEQVRVSPEATANKTPWIWIVREVISKNQAVREYGRRVANEQSSFTYDDNLQHVPATRMGFVYPELDELTRQQQTIDRYTLYLDRSEFLPKGLEMVIVGRALVVPPQPLKFGKVPMVRWTDGSTDPAFYPLAEMNKWIECQQRWNALWSKWIESIRKSASVNLLARENSIAADSFIAGAMNIIGVKGSTPLGDVVKEIGAYSVSQDLTAAMAQCRKMFEDLSGWNDTMRGSYSGDMSGRAVLAVREQVERIFAPMVNAASDAMVDWAKLTIGYMKWGYEVPRLISVEGKSRSDLGTTLAASDIDDTVHVWVDPETLMPMPRALRLSILDDMYQKQLVSAKEYRTRAPFAWTRSLNSPDADHEARAQRIAAALKANKGQPNPLLFPVLWMDDEAIHQTVLEKEILLDDDQPEGVRWAAYERWMILAQQAATKQQGAAVPPPGADESGFLQPNAQGPPAGPNTAAGLQGAAQQLGAAQAPLALQNPPIAAAPQAVMPGTDQSQAARQFEARAPQ